MIFLLLPTMAENENGICILVMWQMKFFIVFGESSPPEAPHQEAEPKNVRLWRWDMGCGPSAQTVPPRTLKQWVAMQRLWRIYCEGEQWGKGSIPWEAAMAVPAAPTQAVESRSMAAGIGPHQSSSVARVRLWCQPAPRCPVTQPFRTLWGCPHALSTHCFSACQSVSIVCSF